MCSVVHFNVFVFLAGGHRENGHSGCCACNEERCRLLKVSGFILQTAVFSVWKAVLKYTRMEASFDDGFMGV